MENKYHNLKNLAFFRFKKLGEDFLLTNNAGDYAFLSPEEFENLLEGGLAKKTKKHKELAEKGFLKEGLDEGRLAAKIRTRNAFLEQGPSLHIIVLTPRCNYNCVYCQASSPLAKKEKGTDMDINTAKQTVDLIFQSPSKHISIEFQGGEPLLNFEVLKFITEYALELNKTEKKDLEISLISNFSLLDEEKIDFLLGRKVGICTSLDGPKEVQNRNRIYTEGNSYEVIADRVRKLNRKYGELPPSKRMRLNALCTVTKFSLADPKGIIKEYLKLGFGAVHLKPLTPLGIAQKAWDKIGYAPEEYVAFFKKALNHVIALNKKGKLFYERTAVIILKKILTGTDPNYFELRSPCGAGIGQLAYNHDGSVYTCDEGRMLAEMGDEIARLGHVEEDEYGKIVGHETVKTLAYASTLENLPACTNCVFKPYCGVCPLHNYAISGSIFAQMPNNFLCKVNMGIMEYLFEKLKDKENVKIFKSWIKKEF